MTRDERRDTRLICCNGKGQILTIFEVPEERDAFEHVIRFPDWVETYLLKEAYEKI